MAIVIERYEEFTPEVANQTIGKHFDSPIRETEILSLGEGVGLMSSIARARLTLENGETPTVIVKCVARTDNKELSKGLNFYSNEINFYEYLADETPVPVPPSLYQAIDPANQDFLLVLEDLGDATAGNQLESCTADQLNAAFRRAAQLHGTFWGRCGEFDWLNHQVDMKTILFRRDAIFRPGIEPCMTGFSEYFTGNRADVVNGIAEQYIDLFLNAMGGEPTIVHGDYRTDNMFLVEDDKGEADIIAFDWQNTMGGNGTHDVAYFCSQSADSALQASNQMDALRLYHDTLKDYGVNLSFDECLDRYRHNLMIVMITPIAICGTLDQGNERGRQLGATVLERSLTALEQMDCAALLK